MTDDTLESYAQHLEHSDDYRVLRRLPDITCYHPPGSESPHIGVYVDVETTGLNPGTDHIIELAMVTFEFHPDGRIFRVMEQFDGLNDPGYPLPEGIIKLTGITDAMVQGQSIDRDKVCFLLDQSVVVIAHNAEFDRVFLESSFPEFAAKAWACSIRDIPWAEEGIDGHKLEYLAFRQGFFYEGHRATTDCLAGIHLLSKALPISGEPTLKVLLDKAREKEYRIWAQGSPFDAKDVLKGRGYRWNTGDNNQPRSWYIDVSGDALKEEVTYLHQQIYGMEVELRIDVMTAFNRYSNRLHPGSR